MCCRDRDGPEQDHRRSGQAGGRWSVSVQQHGTCFGKRNEEEQENQFESQRDEKLRLQPRHDDHSMGHKFLYHFGCFLKRCSLNYHRHASHGCSRGVIQKEPPDLGEEPLKASWYGSYRCVGWTELQAQPTGHEVAELLWNSHVVELWLGENKHSNP